MTERKPTWLQQAVRQTPWRPSTQIAAIVALLMIIAIIIGALYLAQATNTATTGRQLADLAATRDQLQRSNEDLIAAIAFQKDISKLRGRAQELGFVPIDPSRLDYIVVPGYTAQRATPTPEATPQPAYVYDETFNGWVQRQWDILVRQFEAWTSRDGGTPQPSR
jgi:hypothetical protein